MVRVDDDSWDITEGVGATALGMAMARASEASSAQPLFTDQYGQCFVDAAIAAGWQPPYSDETVERVSSVDPAVAAWMRAMTQFGICRTKFFDDFFLAAARDGVRQVVIVAAGLDTRAWRLPWARGTVIYEIDQPKVLDFKLDTLRSHGASSVAEYVACPIDLRVDWPKELQEKGFDPSAATAWSVEGLLPYLPGSAQDLLFERIQALSAPGSRIVVDVFTTFTEPESVRRMRQHTQHMAEAFQQVDAGVGPAEMFDDEALWFIEQRTDVTGWLARHGWATSSIHALAAMACYGRPAPADVDTASMDCEFVEARLDCTGGAR